MKQTPVNSKHSVGISYAEDLLRRAHESNLISFDFFDTLFVRTVIDPEDVFDLVGKRVGIGQFKQIRRQAQTDAFQQMHQDGRKEITMRGIYDKLDIPSFSSETIMQIEYDIELQVALPNEELIPIFRELVASGKKVVITSDMYLPESYFKEALKAFDLPTVDVFVSSEMNCTKRDSGELFELVASRFGLSTSQVLHIGDNPVSDIERASAKGLQTFFYQNSCIPHVVSTIMSPEYSIARGISKRHGPEFHADSYEALGYHYAGPAALAYYEWIKKEAVSDGVEHVLLMARDGYLIDRIARFDPDPIDVPFTYFKGSRTVFTLASMNEHNFTDYLSFLTSGSSGLSPTELLTRINVPLPEQKLFEDVGLGEGSTVSPQTLPIIRDLLLALRSHILKTCRNNARGLFCALNEIGIRPGQRVALVDVGWNGTTQTAFETATAECIPLDVKGYYLALTNSEACVARRKQHSMKAIFMEPHLSAHEIKTIYDNRVVVEFLFSAPHHSIISLSVGNKGAIEARGDARRASDSPLIEATRSVIAGAEKFAQDFYSAAAAIKLPFDAASLLAPLHSLVMDTKWKEDPLFDRIVDFDDWAMTRQKSRKLTSY
ncbi:hypothetical protein ACO34A_04990 [Rhizobium sp. ACO-34A]|nr:HAD-IA family hydrolase [Rhizobium sp. ACO-34A]ATN33157.1 hypothetical protein ACO34A_04990 [Rhizobium sp. ACO-34A]